ncbi:zinc-binding dehydrogenase [Nocardioides sp. YIM 123512]|uniref:Zinc-binding dehydrogenase n=2 Tax=Nocardioides flavescens TaxID=2691959 RepID=A0A6L7ENV5_9ACTN|nr:zinc-binding dehydrogenase [Nocardioides flavescens]
MTAVRFHAYGEPDVLSLEEVERPEPGAGQVRVRVAATSFNGIDANVRAGRMQGPIPVALPHTPGRDVAGTVDALGEGVEGLEVGRPVVTFLPMTEDGASAQFALVDADTLATAPASLPLPDAAALPLVGLTAYQALFDHARLRSGQRVLVNGASGAVGDHAVQLAAAAGAHVIATASPRTAERVRAAGAAEVVDHTAGDVAAALTEPVDVLVQLAPIDPERFAALAARVADGGVVVSTTVWMPAPSDETRGVRAVDVFVRPDQDQLAELVARVDRGELEVRVAERVPLAELADVHARSAAGELDGKVVVVVEPAR